MCSTWFTSQSHETSPIIITKRVDSANTNPQITALRDCLTE